MFKRQFYAVEHAENNDASSSDSSVNTGSDDDSAHEQDDDASSPGEAAPSDEDSDDGEPPESESEDEEWSTFRDRNVKVVQPIDSSHFLLKKPATKAGDGDEETESDKDGAPPETVGDGVVLRIGGVLKCRYCVRIICLNDETMKAHLLSKRHGKSLKQLASGTLKSQLNDDGEEEEEGETHAERLVRIRSIAEEKVVPVKRKAISYRQRQRKRAKQKTGKTEREMQRSAKQKSG